MTLFAELEPHAQAAVDSAARRLATLITRVDNWDDKTDAKRDQYRATIIELVELADAVLPGTGEGGVRFVGTPDAQLTLIRHQLDELLARVPAPREPEEPRQALDPEREPPAEQCRVGESWPNEPCHCAPRGPYHHDCIAHGRVVYLEDGETPADARRRSRSRHGELSATSSPTPTDPIGPDGPVDTSRGPDR